MKRGIFFISALLTVMVTMTGIAAAASYVVGDVKDNNIPVDGAQVEAYDVDTGALLGYSDSGEKGRYAITLPNDYTKSSVSVKAFKDDKSGTTIGDVVFDLNPPASELTIIYIGNINFPIPELPIVATPIAAVLGLVFFFQQRTNKG